MLCSFSGFPATALREIGLLLSIDHPNIVKLKEVVVEKPFFARTRPKNLPGREAEDSTKVDCKRDKGTTTCDADGDVDHHSTDDSVTAIPKNLNRDDQAQPSLLVTPSSSVITYLVFEYCDHDLASLVDHSTRAFSKAEVKYILQYLLRAVEALHLHHIIHRDIKLPNIFLTNKGELKLGDFGLARYVIKKKDKGD